MCLGISTFQNKDDTVKVSKDTMATHETSIVIYTKPYKQSKQSQPGRG